MEQIEFCDKYCPMPARWVEFPKVDNELTVDCDLEESECPFKDVDFSKVKKYSEPEPDNELINLLKDNGYQVTVGAEETLKKIKEIGEAK